MSETIKATTKVISELMTQLELEPITLHAPFALSIYEKSRAVVGPVQLPREPVLRSDFSPDGPSRFSDGEHD